MLEPAPRTTNRQSNTNPSHPLLHIESIQMFEWKGRTSAPTVVRFAGAGSNLYGWNAVQASDSASELTGQFKVALGEVDPSRVQGSRRTLLCDDGRKRTAMEVATVFFEKLLQDAAPWFTKRGRKQPQAVLVAEPLSFFAHADQDWLQNYRASLRRILERYFEHVEFLPEPFAVFQFYRYGVRHHHVADMRKYAALVIDFGGGTFDVSIVETTRDGDISASGRNSKPLGASSTPVGGFFINNKIAEFIARGFASKIQASDEVHHAIARHYRWREGAIEFDALNARNKAFLRNFQWLCDHVEEWKLALVDCVETWNLEGNDAGGIMIDVPDDMFAWPPDLRRARLSVTAFREIFFDDIWKPKVRAAIESALKRASELLRGAKIDVVLLSGGSANIRWLEEFLKRDFANDLENAKTVSLTADYQEIVAKGLAVECARRHHNADGDFRAVTYNPLYLLLNADDHGFECKQLKLLEPDELEDSYIPGQLFQSASSLGEFVGRRLRWKVRLEHAADRCLDYLFLRRGKDGSAEDIVNVVGRSVLTPPGTGIDSHLKVELEIREDGTCTPTFVFKSDREGAPARSASGIPFCLDMSHAGIARNYDAYVGIDFGSSNTSISLVDARSIAVSQERARVPTWLDLASIASEAPFPVALCLRALSGVYEDADVADRTIDALESILLMLVAILWSELTAHERKLIKVIGSLSQRSMGPLKNAVYCLLDAGSQKLPIGSIVHRGLTTQVRQRLEAAIDLLNDYKHGKANALSCKSEDLLELLCNVYRSATQGFLFGRFEDVRRVGLGAQFSGHFRVAHGTPPFGEVLKYSGHEPFSEMQTCLANPATGDVMTLSPLLYWKSSSNGYTTNCDLHVLDKMAKNRNTVEFLVIGQDRSISIEQAADADGIFDQITQVQSGELRAQRYSNIRLVTRER